MKVLLGHTRGFTQGIAAVSCEQRLSFNHRGAWPSPLTISGVLPQVPSPLTIKLWDSDLIGSHDFLGETRSAYRIMIS